MRVHDGIFVNGLRAWDHPNDDRHGVHGKYSEPGGALTGLEVSFTDGKTTMIGNQNGGRYSEIEWDPAEVGVEWMTGYDTPSFAESGVPDVDVKANDRNRWLNVFEMVLTNGDYFCAGARFDTNPEDTYCDKTKPLDPRHSIKGTLLGLSGALGGGGIESITGYFLRSDTKNTEIHDVVLSPSIEELNARAEE
jgi:hypothetical protein